MFRSQRPEAHACTRELGAEIVAMGLTSYEKLLQPGLGAVVPMWVGPSGHAKGMYRTTQMCL